MTTIWLIIQKLLLFRIIVEYKELNAFQKTLEQNLKKSNFIKILEMSNSKNELIREGSNIFLKDMNISDEEIVSQHLICPISHTIMKEPVLGTDNHCYDFKNKYGILVHKYGPHYFRTNSKKIVEYLNHFLLILV